MQLRRGASSSLPLAAVSGCVVALGGCGPDAFDGDVGIELPNSAEGTGKEDVATLRVRLSEASPVVSLMVECDQEPGCSGWLDAHVVSPSACELLGDDPRCGIGGMEPESVDLVTVTMDSTTEGTRTLDLAADTFDGTWQSSGISAEFSVTSGEAVDFLLEKREGVPEMVVELRAEWHRDENPGSAGELEQFLAEVPGLQFSEIATSYPGYRSYELWFEQPLDHDDPDGAAFEQRMVLHHDDVAAPMVLFTSGYDLYYDDYLSELAESLGANQLTTEQRFFGDSIVSDPLPEDWEQVNIRQAAADHHRIVTALKAFYDGSWVSTGHSKGGMTSVYHRRYYPDDIDATVAYVAPISFELPDTERYAPFLDTIGEDECRNALRRLQRQALERFDVLQPRAEAAAQEQDLTYERVPGGHAAAFERSIVQMEWSFWQRGGLSRCEDIPRGELDDDALYDAIVNRYAGFGWSGEPPRNLTYYYQAVTELGIQGYATGHLEDVLVRDDVHEVHVELFSPEGTEPEYSSDAMHDIQDWVIDEASEILFVYGEYDPWTGGAFATGDRPEVLTMYAPQADHGAVIRDLEDADRDAALDAVERWLGARPDIVPGWEPSGAPVPPGLYDAPLLP